MRNLGWLVLLLVFVDELLVMFAFGAWGWHVQGPLLGLVLPPLVMYAWFTFASPKAKYGSGWRRPVVKAIVFTTGSLALWAAGHHGWAVALFAFSLVINGLAQLTSVRSLTATDPEPEPA